MKPKVTIIMATYNDARTLEKTLPALLRLSYPRYDVVVVNDGSTDDTAEVLANIRHKKLQVINIPHAGVCVARNTAIMHATGDIVVNMDQDCIPSKEWLTKLVNGFAPGVGVVSSYGYFGGTSTAFRRDLLDAVGGYDTEYVYYREDTDLSFKIMELGYEFRLVDAPYEHDHGVAAPRGISAMIQYVLKRWSYHMNDVLLYKKHPALGGKFLNVQWGFMIHPLQDFRAATGLWKGEYKLSSPRGITVLENRSPLHGMVIFLAGIAYMVGVKSYRLRGSIKFRKLLI